MDIKELRKLTGLSQSQFARKYHINIWTLQNWERKKAMPQETITHLLERVITEIDCKK